MQKDFDLGLASYSMLLSLLELATDAAKAASADLPKQESIRLDVPPLCVGMDVDTIATAARRVGLA
jgi:hypothetical protein